MAALATSPMALLSMVRHALEPLVRGWYDYRKAHADFNRLARETLNR